MNNEVIAYAKLLDYFGDRVIHATSLIGDEEVVRNSTSVAELQAHWDKLKTARSIFVEVRHMLDQVNPPEIIKEEHLELTDAFSEYIKGTVSLISSVNTQEMSFDSGKYHLGIAAQVINETRTKDIIERIISKLA